MKNRQYGEQLSVLERTVVRERRVKNMRHMRNPQKCQRGIFEIEEQGHFAPFSAVTVNWFDEKGGVWGELWRGEHKAAMIQSPEQRRYYHYCNYESHSHVKVVSNGPVHMKKIRERLQSTYVS